MYRPAGVSDESSDDEGTIFLPMQNRKSHHDEVGPSSGQAQPAGRLGFTHSPVQEVRQHLDRNKKPLNAKQRRSKKFWAEKRALEKEEKLLPPFEDPKEKPEGQDFFRFAKQTNMNLRSDLQQSEFIGVKNPDHLAAIQKWALSDVNLNIQDQTTSERLIVLGDPLVNYRNIPVYYIDYKNFNLMIEIIGAGLSELSIDIECNMSHSFLGMTALLQIATRKVSFLIDPFSCFHLVQKHIQPMIENPKILKLMFGMGNDCKQFQKDFGVKAIGVVDLQLLYNQYRADKGKNLVGLENVCKKILPDFQPIKSCTLVDWRRRPLTKDMALYAASDTILLFELWENLKQLLTGDEIEIGIAQSKVLLTNAYKTRSYPAADDELKNIHGQELSQREYDCFCLLHQWRERYAAISDVVPHNLVKTDVLLRISKLPFPATNMDFKSTGFPEAVLNEQGGTIGIIVNDDGKDLFKRINNCKCHNCLLVGHAAAHCPFPPNKDRTKQWGEMHPEYKTAQNRRRNQNKKRNKRQAKLTAQSDDK